MNILKLLIFVTIFLMSLSSQASKLCAEEVFTDIRLINIQKLLPTQMEVGKSLVKEKAKKYSREADKVGRSLEEFMFSNGKASIPVVISPKGEFFVTDSHHTISALLLLEPNSKMNLRVEVIKDYTRNRPDGALWSYKQFIENLVGKKKGQLAKGQFTEDLWKARAIEKFNNLPRSFDEMGDNPMRSMIGLALRSYGVKGGVFADYFQFILSPILVREGYVLPINLKYSKKQVDELAEFILNNEKALSYLYSNYRSENKKEEAYSMLDKAILKINRPPQ